MPARVLLAISAALLSSTALAAPAVPPTTATSKAQSQAQPAQPPAAAPTASAADKSRIQDLEQKVDDLSRAVQDLKRSGSSQNADQQRRDGEAKLTLPNGRPTFATPDGAFSAALRAIVQFDGAYYSQDSGATSATPDLSSGTNFRRARIGLDGKVFKDFDYSFIYDFGGSGVEGTSISAAYVQYSGLAPVFVRIGAFAPFANLEDSAGPGDTLFLERASINEISRGLTAGDGRSALAVFAQGERYLASAAYTGGRAGQAAAFDEQQALVGRLAVLLYTDANTKLNVGIHGSYLFDPADAAAGPGSPSANIIYQNQTELRVDAANLVSTGNIDADSATHWGADAGLVAGRLYAEGGYTRFDVDRRGSTAPDPQFDGWYLQASVFLTNDARRYDARSQSFKNPSVKRPLGTAGGWGAWEIAARYSTLDLDSHEGAAGAPTPAGGIRGGTQDIWTAGLNWYPNNAVRVLLDYQNAEIDRLNGAGTQIGQTVDQVSLRVQFAF